MRGYLPAVGGVLLVRQLEVSGIDVNRPRLRIERQNRSLLFRVVLGACVVPHLVASNRSADRRLDESRRAERLVADLVPQARVDFADERVGLEDARHEAVSLVRPALGNDVDDGALIAGVFGGESTGDEFHLLDKAGCDENAGAADATIETRTVELVDVA